MQNGELFRKFPVLLLKLSTHCRQLEQGTELFRSLLIFQQKLQKTEKCHGCGVLGK
jgi:hypothetical protein